MIAVIITLIVVGWLLYRSKRRADSPPGPWNIPLIGQTFSLGSKHQERALGRWAERYGPVYSIRLFGQEVVVIGDPNLIRETFSKPATAFRLCTDATRIFRPDGTGIVESNGPLNEYTRRFTLFHFRNFGVGKSKLEDAIQTYINMYMNEIITPELGKPMELDTSLAIAIVNILYGIITGNTIHLRDKEGAMIMETIHRANELACDFLLANFVPVLAKVLPEKFLKLREFTEKLDASKIILTPELEKHRKDFDECSEPRDFLDCLLHEQKKNPEMITDRHILDCCAEVFFAGSDTTTTTLRWAFCFLCACPHVQQRLQQEIDQVVGRSRPPVLADKPSMPYTEAVIMEVQRLGDVTPNGVMHCTMEDFTLAGYRIAKGTILIPLHGFIHKSSKHFTDPLTFNPERFLDAEGRFTPSKAVMPFSVGKRQCIGEPLARSELFLFITTILQKFSFRFPDGFTHDFSINEEWFGNEPSPFKVIPTLRE